MLYAGNTIPLADLDRSKSALLQSRYAYVTSKTVIDNNQIETEQLAQTILELQQDCLEKRKEYSLALKQSFGNLQNQLKLWQQNYLLASPVDGNVTFTTYWSINQNVSQGDKVMTIVPDKPSVLVGKITLPVKGSGKVKQGQKVNIRLDNYPYMEFGMVKGIVKSISLVAANNNYAVEVEFPEGLHTTYGKTLAFAQEMQGSAEIITENKRLLTRLFNPLRALLNE
jgi:HlyD family secretion protein